MLNRDNLRVGIVANEFFDKKIGRLGGFGWAAQRAAEVFRNHPKCNIAPFFFTSDRVEISDTRSLSINGTPFILLNGSRLKNMAKLLPKRIDILLTIDYREKYRAIFNALPFTPIITWVRDPRSPDDIKKMMSLRIPGKEAILPGGISDNPTGQLAGYSKKSLLYKRQVILANKMPHMRSVNRTVYDLPESDFILPNPSIVNYQATAVKKSERPSIIYLGRLDPIKRPWIFFKLAENFPKYDFYLLGKNHFEGDDGWNFDEVPENLHITGHISGSEKYELLSKAWVLVNTSINEESPVSIMEAFAYETPAISFEDWGDLVKNRGIVIGQRNGTGLDGLSDLSNALETLITDHKLRKSYGKEARRYVEENHNDETFLSAFREICLACGIKKAAKAITV